MVCVRIYLLKVSAPKEHKLPYLAGYIYLITRVSVQYRELLHEWAWYFHEPNECNKVFIIHYHNSVVSLLTQSPE